jgi:hypothetical protein
VPRAAIYPEKHAWRRGRPGRLRHGVLHGQPRGGGPARELIEARQYVLDSDRGEAQPAPAAQNTYLESHSWAEYARWHLGLTDGAADETKARYAFVYGDFRRVHRTALIACVYRASEWRHKDVELAAHDLLQLLDEKSG